MPLGSRECWEAPARKYWQWKVRHNASSTAAFLERVVNFTSGRWLLSLLLLH